MEIWRHHHSIHICHQQEVNDGVAKPTFQFVNHITQAHTKSLYDHCRWLGSMVRRLRLFIDQSGRSESVKLDGPIDLKWTIKNTKLEGP